MTDVMAMPAMQMQQGKTGVEVRMDPGFFLMAVVKFLSGIFHKQGVMTITDPQTKVSRKVKFDIQGHFHHVFKWRWDCKLWDVQTGIHFHERNRKAEKGAKEHAARGLTLVLKAAGVLA